MPRRAEGKGERADRPQALYLHSLILGYLGGFEEVLAEALLLGGGSDEAIRIARSLIGGPNEVDGHYVLALPARDAGDGATALREFKKALKIYDDHHRARNERRVCAHDMQADVCGEILKLRPGVPPEAR